MILLNETLTGQMNVGPVERLLDLQSISSVPAARESSSTCGVPLVDAHARACSSRRRADDAAQMKTDALFRRLTPDGWDRSASLQRGTGCRDLVTQRSERLVELGAHAMVAMPSRLAEHPPWRPLSSTGQL